MYKLKNHTEVEGSQKKENAYSEDIKYHFLNMWLLCPPPELLGKSQSKLFDIFSERHSKRGINQHLDDEQMPSRICQKICWS